MIVFFISVFKRERVEILQNEKPMAQEFLFLSFKNESLLFHVLSLSFLEKRK